MLAIRLTRTGKIHAPHYRIVVQEKRSKLNGAAIDTIGHYHPASANKELVVDNEKALDWLKKGAQPSDTVTNLFVKVGVFDKSRMLSNFYTPKPKEEVKEVPAEPETVAEENAETEVLAEEAIEGEEAVAEEKVEEAAAEVAEEAPTIEEEPAAEEA